MARSQNTAQETETATVTAEVMEVPNQIPASVYAEVATWEDAIRAVQNTFETIDNSATVLGDGFAVVENKATLIGVSLLLAEWKFRKGDNGDYVAIRAFKRSEDGSLAKLVITDGSQGICKQLREYSERTGKTGGLFVRNGLRVSEYEYEPGKMARTFYLDTSA